MTINFELKNAEYRVPPTPQQRAGRHTSSVATRRLVPMQDEGTDDGYDRTALEPGVKGETPISGKHGLVDYVAIMQGGSDDMRRFFPRDFIPEDASVQLVSGPTVKVAYRNTAKARMIAGTVAKDDLLTPKASGSDIVGYWEKTTTPGEEWARVTNVNPDGTIEVQMTF